ncbi:dihydroorotase [Legionella dresdenensis]|uniref:Dihydroorotase n=1 Tax=Legionella dresdenensis TaxID=450200 RepID=A0ABV8CI16_9GAMM
MNEITITRPDDWHVHLRDGLALNDTVKATANHFARALVMPNLQPALTTLSSLLDYRRQILAALPNNSPFIPLHTFYLNEHVSPDDLIQCNNYSWITGGKLYPAGATTNSAEGAQSLKALYPLLEVMQQQDLVLQIHGEINKGDVFERESQFIATYLNQLVADFPRLRIVLEHISTKAAVDFILNAPATVAATITPHHLLYNRNHMLAGGIRPHYYCLPILKKESDQLALHQAALSGNPKFFAGTDSAPHAIESKQSSCGCAGIYSAPFAVALYTQFFDNAGQLTRLNPFISNFGADFYRLPHNDSQLLIIRKEQTIPASMPLGDKRVVPVAAGEVLSWSVYESL